MKFKSLVFVCVSVGACVSTGVMYGAESSASRLQTSNEVLGEIMGAPDSGIPQELLEKSQCIVIVPGLKKGAFILGGKYGRGYILCRENAGRGWSAPGGVTVEGGSFGFQIGGEETDAVMLVMSKSGARKLLASKFTLGGDASVAAGPWAELPRPRRIFSCTPRFLPIPVRAGYSQAFPSVAPPCGRTGNRTASCIATDVPISRS